MKEYTFFVSYKDVNDKEPNYVRYTVRSYSLSEAKMQLDGFRNNDLNLYNAFPNNTSTNGQVFSYHLLEVHEVQQ